MEENELITTHRDGRDDYDNDLTREMDKHLFDCWSKAKEYGASTYIMEIEQFDDIRCAAIRFPGATRGHVEIDNDDIITNVSLYDTACDDCVKCYKQTVKDAVKKFIGMKLIYEEDKK